MPSGYCARGPIYRYLIAPPIVLYTLIYIVSAEGHLLLSETFLDSTSTRNPSIYKVTELWVSVHTQQLPPCSHGAGLTFSTWQPSQSSQYDMYLLMVLCL